MELFKEFVWQCSWLVARDIKEFPLRSGTSENCNQVRGKLSQATVNTVEPLNNGHVGDEHFVHCSEVVHSSEVEMCGQAGGEQCVHCREVVHSSECPLSEVPL